MATRINQGMDSLTPELLQPLLALGLCSPRDLRRCRARVRKLCRDLPAFDSVWLDALVQLGRLTHFQAQVCAAGGPVQLVVGPYLLVHRCGVSGGWETFTARRPGETTLVALTRIPLHESERDLVLARFHDLLSRLPTTPHAENVAPRAVQWDRDALVVVAPHVSGYSLSELLIRRGRFPVSVVWEVLRRTAMALESLERCGLVHGDVRLRQILLTPEGRLYATQPGMLPALEPWVRMHADLPAEACDGIAPELIDTRRERSLASEMYACGCLVWQLLAGRPPFTDGDPLAKLAAHQTRRVPDVRSAAPETPPDLAALLERLTHPDPAYRPLSFTAVLEQIGRPAGQQSPRLKQFVQRFQSAAPRSLLPEEAVARPRGRVLIAATASLLLMAAGWMQWSGRLDGLKLAHASASRGPVAAGVDTPSDVVPSPVTSAKYKPLPEPRQGVIELNSDGPYRARPVSAIGPLSLIGVPGMRPVIVVDNEPLQLMAAKVMLQNVTVSVSHDSAKVAESLLHVTAQDFGLVDCRLIGPLSTASAARSQTSPSALVAWQPLDASVSLPGRIGWVNVSVEGAADGLWCVSSPASIQLQNVVQVGAGRLLRLPTAAAARPLPVAMRRVTVRDSLGLVSLAADPQHRPAALLLSLEHCVLSFATNGGLLELRDPASPAVLAEACLACRISGLETYLPSESALVVHRATQVDSLSLDADQLSVEGLQFARVDFASPPHVDWRRAQIQAIDGRRPAPSIGCDLAPFQASIPAAELKSAALDEPTAPGGRDLSTGVRQ